MTETEALAAIRELVAPPLPENEGVLAAIPYQLIAILSTVKPVAQPEPRTRPEPLNVAPKHVHDALDVVWDGIESDGKGNVWTPASVDSAAIDLLNRTEPRHDAQQRMSIELFRALSSTAALHR